MVPQHLNTMLLHTLNCLVHITLFWHSPVYSLTSAQRILRTTLLRWHNSTIAQIGRTCLHCTIVLMSQLLRYGAKFALYKAEDYLSDRHLCWPVFKVFTLQGIILTVMNSIFWDTLTNGPLNIIWAGELWFQFLSVYARRTFLFWLV